MAGVDPEAPRVDGAREARREDPVREADLVQEAQSERRQEWLLRSLHKLARLLPIQVVAREPETHSNWEASKGLRLTFASE